MAHLAIINPPKRRKAGRKAKRRANPVARKRTKRVKHRRVARRAHARRANPVARKTRRTRRRHNPKGLSVTSLKNRVMPALTGAVGAMLLDKGIDMLGTSLPTGLSTGWGRVAAKVGITLLAGYALEKTKVLGADSRNSLVAGALTVTAYQAIQSEVMPMIGSGFSTAPAPATQPKIDPVTGKVIQGYQYGQLSGYQYGTLSAMPNSGMVLPMGTPDNVRRFV